MATHVRFPCLKGDTTRKLRAYASADGVGDAFAALTEALRTANRVETHRAGLAMVDMLEHHPTDMLALTLGMAAGMCSKREIRRDAGAFVDVASGEVMCEFFTNT
ncbi:hypothetical protein [Medusavirus stheno T3]|uniref:Uncharacterized protein n=1 Tax=Medusavirus stheno T3 TaxID=3069717 RepID=A0A7S7YEJ7_9VIRU|nr:hypothetical protein QKU73_gp157 [Acanthamoeba castellanii medusavirus]QPB44338.1 hypothetical protein [Medusavirus stheno T3]